MRKSPFFDMKKVLFWVSKLDSGVTRFDVRASTLDLGAITWDNVIKIWL